METNRINNHNQARNQEFFGAGKVSWNKGTSINDSCVTHKKKFGVFSPSCSQNYILNENLTHRCTQTRQIFPKIKALFFAKSGHFLSIFKKGQRKRPPHLISNNQISEQIPPSSKISIFVGVPSFKIHLLLDSNNAFVKKIRNI